MKPLTWYPGTILPYASLWHTVLRATWLNDLRANDIWHLCRSRESSGKDRSVQEARTVVSALGEPMRALSKFSVLEQFPSNLRSTCMDRWLRWCPVCIATGFHTLLGNIRLLSYFPIHGDPLIEECPKCHERFKMRLSGLIARQRRCQCGQTQLLTLCESRQPSMRAAETSAWTPVAHWVKQVGNVLLSQSFVKLVPPHIQLALTARWCHDNGIAYPDCFDDEPTLWRDMEEAKCWTIYKASSSHLKDHKISVPQNLPHARPKSDQTIVYKAIGRHLRRHGFANPDRAIKTLMRTFDPAVFATTMAKSQKARVAFAEMLWARQLEPWAVTRRWPNRPSFSAFSSDQTTNISLHDSVGRIFVRDLPISDSAYHWVVQHATALEARQAWGRAILQTDQSIAKGWADWYVKNEQYGNSSFTDCVVWFSRLKGMCIQFVGYVRNAHCTRFLTSLPTKQARREGLAMACRGRKEIVEGLAKHPCLCWSQRDGWRVENGIPPDDDDVRRIALLHTGQPTDCWIFKNQNLFVVRLFNGNIQASGLTPREALCSLRSAVMQYRNTFEADHGIRTSGQSAFPAVLPTLVNATRYAQWHVMQSKGHGTERFWSNASIVSEVGARWIDKGQHNEHAELGLPPQITAMIGEFDARNLKLDEPPRNS